MVVASTAADSAYPVPLSGPMETVMSWLAIVAAEAQVVFAVNPAQGFGDGDGLREREARLLLVEPLDIAEHHVGQTVIERSAIRPLDADLVRYIGPIGEEIRRLASAAVPTGVQDVG